MEIAKTNNNNNNCNKRKRLDLNDDNGNGNSKLTTENNNNNNGNDKDKKITKIRDEIVTKDGRLYYLCRYCNKVFHIKKERTVHLRKCPAKSYILTIADNYNSNNNNNNNDDDKEKNNSSNNIDKDKKFDAFDRLLASKTNEIYLNNETTNVKQNNVLNKKTKSKIPMKLTIYHSPNKNSDNTTITLNTTNDKEAFKNHDNKINNNNNDVEAHKNKDNTINNDNANDEETRKNNDNTIDNNVNTNDEETHKNNDNTNDVDTLKNNDNTINNNNDNANNEETFKNNDNMINDNNDNTNDEDTLKNNDNTINNNNNDNMVKVLCRQCKLTFNNGIELLRHQRELHKYPKIIMAFSEIKRCYYNVKDWTKCPICMKPLQKNYRSTYLRHLNTHANEFHFNCKICDKKFRRSDHMKEHEKRHIIEKQQQQQQHRQQRGQEQEDEESV